MWQRAVYWQHSNHPAQAHVARVARVIEVRSLVNIFMKKILEVGFFD